MPSLLHTGLTVRDLDRSLAFYRDLLGMELVFAQEKQGGYLAADRRLPGRARAHGAPRLPGRRASGSSCSSTSGPSRVGAPGEPRAVGITHVCLLVRRPRRRLRARCARPGSGSSRRRCWSTRAPTPAASGVYLRDPDGIIARAVPGHDCRGRPHEAATDKVCVVTGARAGHRPCDRRGVRRRGRRGRRSSSSTSRRPRRTPRSSRARGVDARAYACDVSDRGRRSRPPRARSRADLGPLRRARQQRRARADGTVARLPRGRVAPLDRRDADRRVLLLPGVRRASSSSGGGAIVNIASMNADRRVPDAPRLQRRQGRRRADDRGARDRVGASTACA